LSIFLETTKRRHGVKGREGKRVDRTRRSEKAEDMERG